MLRGSWGGAWAAERLGRIRECGVEPIVGLVHHGSGPLHTSLLDTRFVEGLASHAREVAERFPWVRYYTPINEPLTTARFSCLYGHWHPHARDPFQFGRALLIQIAAIKAAMREIRKVNPGAQLVQTEDMGRVYSTRRLAYQAEFENERRWLSLDLLCGRVDSGHLMWSYLRWAGLAEEELGRFLDEPCVPDIVGINHYVTSERFLDERLERYPQSAHGGNHQHSYADVPAVRVCRNGVYGPYGVLKETWQRYELPMAVTEAHLSCTREEQLRWLMEIWRAGCQLRREGVDLRAVTVWSMLGAFDWDSLLTRPTGNYESGVFDLRAPQPRPTALVKCMQSLAATGDFRHPILCTQGWWKRPARFVHRAARAYNSKAFSGRFLLQRETAKRMDRRPILITGATGTLGSGFQRVCESRGLVYRLVGRCEMDICNAHSIRRVLSEANPWAVVNAAGYVRVDEAENDRDRCFRENVFGPVLLAKVCEPLGIPFVTFSSDLVFDGRKGRPYVESDWTHALNVYGQSKAEAERQVLEIMPLALVVRTSCFFGPWDPHNFVARTLQQMRDGERVIVARDACVSPTYVPHLIQAVLDLLIDNEHGIWHLANRGAITWGDFARWTAALIGGTAMIDERSAEELGWPAMRPAYSVLGSERGTLLPTLEEALDCYAREAPPQTDEGLA